jgi:acetyltransferase
MPVPLLAASGRYRPELFFRPESVAVIGAQTVAGGQVMANLLAARFTGAILPVAPALSAISGVLAYPDIPSLPLAPDLAVLCDGRDVAGQISQLAARGVRAAVVVAMAEGLTALAAAHGMRIMGPGSFGMAVPAIGLNATSAHLVPRPGRLALVSQSAALCRAVLDWAEPNGVGFSHIIGVGGNADFGFAPALDWLSRDSGTGAILLDIRRIRDPRRFLSAARAASRLRPVVAIRAGGRLIDASGDADAVFEAALRRAGVLCVTSLEDLLAAAETLTRAKPLRAEALAIVTNAVGPAQMAADAALRDGLVLAALTPETRQVLRLGVPHAFATSGGADVPHGVGDIVYAGLEDPIKLAEAAAMLAGAREVGAVLVVHAPTGPGDAAGIEAIAAAAGAMRVPLLVCAMGETTGALHRARLAGAGVPVFASPEQAVRGVLHLVQHRRNRDAARELPPSAVLLLEPDRAGVRTLLDTVRARDSLDLSAEEAMGVLAAYGIATHAPANPVVLVRVTDDAMFGPAIAVGEGGKPRGAAGPWHDVATDLPPLNLPLARALLSRTRIATTLPATAREAVADVLVRVSQLTIDFPEIASLEIAALGIGTVPATAADCAIVLRPAGERARIAIPPYPAELVGRFDAKGDILTVRPIRPEDAEAHAALFTRLSPQDVRYRFFSALRELSADQMVRMTQVDYEREMAFVAVRDHGADAPETVGVARLVREIATGSGEFAVVVQPDVKGRGVARHLMQRLIDWATEQGMASIQGQILAENAGMLAFIRRLGFTIHRIPSEMDVLEARLALHAPPGTGQADGGTAGATA